MHDVIVVGGGVVGATVAYLCAREGLRTVLLDRADPGRATDAGAGIVSPATSTRHETLFEFGLRAAAYYAVLLDHVAEDGGGDTGYARCADLRVAVSGDELAPFATLVSILGARRARHGQPAPADVHEVGPDEAQAMVPPLARPLRAMLDRTAARVDGRLLTRALRRAAARRGLLEVTASAGRLLVEGGRAAGAEADGKTYRGGHVVVAGGAWSPALGEPLGVSIPVVPQRGQIVHLRVPGPATDGWPVVHGFHDHYLVSWPDGRVVAGASRETGSGFDSRLTAGGIRDVLSEALRVAPGLTGAGLHETRVGLRPMSADGLPVLGCVPGVTGAWLATGHGPSGLTLGPYSARLVCDLILGRPGTGVLAPFALDRFARAPCRTGPA